jgi:hypothetical protein
MVVRGADGAEADFTRENKAGGGTIASLVKHEEGVPCVLLGGTKVTNVSEDTKGIKRERNSYRA